ncbi:hypothetical protein AAFN47_26440 [Hoeflea sp. CAU 1731]
MKLHLVTALALCLSPIAASSAFAQDDASVAEFYEGKTITFLVGARPGGMLDIYTRLLGKHMMKRIPGNPDAAYRSDDANGGMMMADFMQNNTPGDGTHIGTTQDTVPVSQVINPGVGNFDVRSWSLLGSMKPNRFFLALWKDGAPVDTLEGLKETEVLIGSTGKTSPTYIFPALMNEFLDTKLNVIPGYNFGAAHLAMEQGETQGIASAMDSFRALYPQYLEQNKLMPIVQFALTPDPELSGVPLFVDVVEDPVNKQVAELAGISGDFGRFYYMGPDVPAERVEAVRKAFEETLTDPEFLADADEAGIDIEYVPYQHLDALLNKIHSAPADVLEKAQAAMALQQ